MKISLILSAIFFSTVTLFAQHRSIEFEHVTFKEAKEKALKENKLIFIDAYTSWCGPCKLMAKNIFTNDTVADYYNKNFVNTKIDMEQEEGPEIAKIYEVKCYPTLLFIDGNGKLIHRVAGSMSPKDFIALAEDTKVSDKCFSYFSKNYEANKNNSEFLYKYIEARSATCFESDDLVKKYFLLQKENDLMTSKNWNMINDHINSIDSKEFKYVITNKQKYSDLYSSKSVDEKIDDVLRSSLYNIIQLNPFSEDKYKSTKQKITLLNQPNTKFIFFESDLQLAEKKSDWLSYTKLAIENVDLYYLNNAEALNAIAWTIYERVSNMEALIRAESWAKKACELEDSYANLDTYASILFKVGKKDDALLIAKKAIHAAEKDQLDPKDYESTSNLILKIKS
jgi:thioredoxin-related protein